jgi:hypothetical protein
MKLADSGEREVAPSGFTREPDIGRRDMSWLFEIPGLELVPRELFERMARHYAAGAAKYSADNWRKGTRPQDLERYRRSLVRHLFAWMRHENDEDHAAAVIWNIITYEINHQAAVCDWVRPDLDELI